MGDVQGRHLPQLILCVTNKLAKGFICPQEFTDLITVDDSHAGIFEQMTMQLFTFLQRLPGF